MTIMVMIKVIINRNVKTQKVVHSSIFHQYEWEECLPFINFSYNKVVHSVIECTPFEIVYRFNPLSPIGFIIFTF